MINSRGRTLIILVKVSPAQNKQEDADSFPGNNLALYGHPFIRQLP